MQSADIMRQLAKFVYKTGRLPELKELGSEQLATALIEKFGSIQHLRSLMFLQMKSYVFSFYRFTVENLFYGCTHDGIRVLDAGCGKGDSLRNYSRPTNAEIVGVDFLKENVAACKRRWKNASYVVADLALLPFVDGVFDVVLCVDVLEHAEDKAFTVTEFARVSRLGGCFVGSSTNVLNPVLWIDATFPTLVKSLVLKFSNVSELVERHSRFSPSGLSRVLKRAGYEVEHLAMVGTPLFDKKQISWLSHLWIFFDRLTKWKPLLFLKETMVWQAVRVSR